MFYEGLPTENAGFKRRHDLKQETVAKYPGVNQSYYSKYEPGKKTLPLEKLILLCEYYNVSADCILGFTDEERPLNKKKEVK